MMDGSAERVQSLKRVGGGDIQYVVHAPVYPYPYRHWWSMLRVVVRFATTH